VDDRRFSGRPRVLAIGDVCQRMHPCVATAMADGVVAAKTLEALYRDETGPG
jgi:thioredoxin reductase (NADPH)